MEVIELTKYLEYLEYKGYRGTVVYSKAENCYFGKAQGMNQDCITYEGETLDQLEVDFQEA